MRYIFVAFYGWPNSGRQANSTEIIEEHFECWDLKQFTLDEFVKAIQIKIPPINNNVLRHYITLGDGDFGVTEEQYKDCSWGLLRPDPDEYGSGFKKVASVLNLYSTAFMRPAFYVSDFGITVTTKKVLGNWLNAQNKSEIFKSTNFVTFYKKMIKAVRYFQWFRDNVLAWNDEDWRLYMAASFYDDLVQYENAKSMYTWQRESADMATLLETLFTAGESEKDEIVYRLKKRAFILIGWRFPCLEKEVRELYKDRSDFVHGNFYKKIVKSMKKNKDGDTAMPPPPDFKKLYQLKERVRFLLVAYLYLNEIKLSGAVDEFRNFDNVQNILEGAILDTKLREVVIDRVKLVVDLLPESEKGYL